MKILSFTDLHGNLKALGRIAETVAREKPALICCLGDFTVFEHDIEPLLARIDQLGPEVLMINGNHEDESRLARLCRKSKHVTFIHKGMVKKGVWTFLGYGGGGFQERYREFESWTRTLKVEWKKAVVMTHAPPHGTTLDNVGETEDPWHVGSKSFTEFIVKRKPALFLSGHIHECFLASDTIGRTRIENPGPMGKIYDLRAETV